MTHRLTTNCAKYYCNLTLIVKVIVENVVTCFLLGHGVYFTIEAFIHALLRALTLALARLSCSSYVQGLKSKTIVSKS